MDRNNDELEILQTYSLLENIDFRAEDVCVDCEYISRGFYAAMNEYMMQSRDIILRLQNGKDVNLSDLGNRREELVKMIGVLSDTFDEKLEKLIARDSDAIIITTLAYCSLVFVLYYTIYLNNLNNVQQQITNIWSIGRLIPIDHRNKIIQAFRSSEVNNNSLSF